jgi:hypothetical protein
MREDGNMNRDTIGLLQTIATVAATLAAISAIAIGYYQFQNQQYNEDLIAHANIKPILEVVYEYSEDVRLLEITNHGLGTAVITSIKFYRDNDVNSSASSTNEFTNLAYNSSYDYYYQFSAFRGYIRSGDSIVISKVTKDYLEKQGFYDYQIEEILKSWESQFSKILVNITYTDVLGEEQEKIEVYLL